MSQTNDKLDNWTARQNNDGALSARDPPHPTKWQLLYWPAVNAAGEIEAGAGRAEYLRVLFEEAGEPYEEVTSDLRAYFWQDADTLQPAGFPVLAPPAIRKGGFALCQTAVCAKFLAQRLGLYPADPLQAAKGEQVVATVHEYIAEGRMAFHPVKNTLSYHRQADEAAPHIDAFRRERLPRYMGIFERLLASNNNNNNADKNADSSSHNQNNEDHEDGDGDGDGDDGNGSGYFVGRTATYVDLQVMVMLQVTAHQWPAAWAALDAPLLKAFLRRMEGRPAMRRYLQSGRKQPFAGDSLM